MTDRRIQYMDLDKIEGALLNPKGHAEQDLAVSLERWGFTEAPLLDERTGRLVVGHGRIDALRARRDRGEAAPDGVRVTKAGRWQVPAQRGWASKDDQEAFAYLVAGNQLTTAGGWTPELGPALDELAAQGSSLDGLGFTGDDLDQLLPSRQPDPPAVPDEDVPRPPENPVTTRGDVWGIGPHRLMCGDSRSTDDVAKLLDGSAVNLAVTSPPYADRRKYDPTSGFEPIPPDRYVEWFAPIAERVAERLAPDGSWVVNIKPGAEGLDRDMYVYELVVAHVRMWGWHLGDEFCWARQGIPTHPVLRLKSQFEPVYHFARARWKFRPDNVMQAGGKVSIPQAYSAETQGFPTRRIAQPGDDSGMAYPGTRLPTFNGTHELTGHSAAYPVGLPGFFVRLFTDAGDVIFDPFNGSGSTVLAADQHGRVGRGMELSPGYCDVTLERLQRHTGLIPTRDGEPHDFSAGAKVP